MAVLVTGGAGYIGSHTVLELLAAAKVVDAVAKPAMQQFLDVANGDRESFDAGELFMDVGMCVATSYIPNVTPASGDFTSVLVKESFGSMVRQSVIDGLYRTALRGLVDSYKP